MRENGGNEGMEKSSSIVNQFELSAVLMIVDFPSKKEGTISRLEKEADSNTRCVTESRCSHVRVSLLSGRLTWKHNKRHISLSLLLPNQATAIPASKLAALSASKGSCSETSPGNPAIRWILQPFPTDTSRRPNANSMTPEEELLDQVSASVLRSLLEDNAPAAEPPRRLQVDHSNTSKESDGNDGDGQQGGQSWRPPTASPTPLPTAPPTRAPSASPTPDPSLSPSWSPTDRPTLRRDPFELRGTIWYDRNGNGARDSGIAWGDFGDVEYSHGLGGVSVQLMSCDEEGDGSSMASVISPGFDVQMRPSMAKDGGRYNLVNIFANRKYYIRVTAPDGYLFTTGICNDDIDGWECPQTTRSRHLQESDPPGIKEGRSTKCVTVDDIGVPDSRLDIGAMRIGDSRQASANIALVFGFDEMQRTLRGRPDVGPSSGRALRSNGRMLLEEDDKQTIGTVTAEVLVDALDSRLAKSNITLDSIEPKDVIISGNKIGGAGLPSDQLAVALSIRGHYNPPPYIQFDDVVQDSINRDTGTIRRGLREYNQNCREKQSLGIHAGYTNGESTLGTACSSGKLLPDYFETSLAEIEARDVSEVEFRPSPKSIPVVISKQSALDSWALGPVSGIAGLIALLLGLFMFRRALGPRYVDEYQHRRTKELNEPRRFGEAGGAMDDGSVDSAFYSEEGKKKPNQSTRPMMVRNRQASFVLTRKRQAQMRENRLMSIRKFISFRGTGSTSSTTGSAMGSAISGTAEGTNADDPSMRLTQTMPTRRLANYREPERRTKLSSSTGSISTVSTTSGASKEKKMPAYRNPKTKSRRSDGRKTRSSRESELFKRGGNPQERRAVRSQPRRGSDLDDWKHDWKHDMTGSDLEVNRRNQPRRGSDLDDWKHDWKHDRTGSDQEVNRRNQSRRGSDLDDWKHGRRESDLEMNKRRQPRRGSDLDNRTRTRRGSSMDALRSQSRRGNSVDALRSQSSRGRDWERPRTQSSISNEMSFSSLNSSQVSLRQTKRRDGTMKDRRHRKHSQRTRHSENDQHFSFSSLGSDSSSRRRKDRSQRNA